MTASSGERLSELLAKRDDEQRAAELFDHEVDDEVAVGSMGGPLDEDERPRDGDLRPDWSWRDDPSGP